MEIAMLLCVNILLLTLACLVLLPVAMFCAEIAASLLPRRRFDAAKDNGDASEACPTTAVLIPAHNEGQVISETLATLVPALDGNATAYVIADNCTDNTARLAQAAGAVVLKRENSEQRGKGYALDYAVQHLEAQQQQPDVVVIIDADCQVQPDTVKGIAQAVYRAQRPAQGLNLTDRDVSGGQKVVAQLGNRLTNLVRPLGLWNLGLPCQMMGTGMALPFDLVRNGRLASGSLVEDKQMGVNLAMEGHYPMFLPAYRVSSAQPGQESAFLTQRTRWEHGHISVAAALIPPLLATAVLKGKPRLLAVAFDLAIPPLALLAGIWLLGTAVAAAAIAAGAWMLPLLLLAAGGGGMMLAVLTAWAAHCRKVIPAGALLGMPLYALRKAPVYFAFFFKAREKQWVRTSR